MLFASLFLAGFMLGIFTALKIFSPEQSEETWDPQRFPGTVSEFDHKLQKPNLPSFAESHGRQTVDR